MPGSPRLVSPDQLRYVVHLPVLASDLDRARQLARAIARSLRRLSAVDPGETTVSEEADQGVRHRVFCDRLVGERGRCVLRTDHDGLCTRRVTR
ncbi:hypothetical protein GCM10027280_32760 [Micromonospora polyrhachis]|uniref:Uncharacterized protein n=1 Tax=Micromonospora polyrhachis TaxID=1282883 RepID=A0A7W7STZ4_9ACTN|nr:hypothetical protein [Micromonospora polyrhachis]MBB4960869.1 hypothetical protein [Micromonospora polyrhachis]